MNQEILDNLKIGEKAVDIQEYYHGKNGSTLVYKVIIYECVRKFLIFKKIESYSYPFYFVSKEFAESFIKDIDKFDIIKNNYNMRYGNIHAYSLYPKQFESPKYRYFMVDARHPYVLSETHSMRLENEGIWGGIVNYESMDPYGELYRNKNMSYTEIFEKEKLASKEGSIGKIFSYKLTEA